MQTDRLLTYSVTAAYFASVIVAAVCLIRVIAG